MTYKLLDAACGIKFPDPALSVWSLSPWTTRQVPSLYVFTFELYKLFKKHKALEQVDCGPFTPQNSRSSDKKKQGPDTCDAQEKSPGITPSEKSQSPRATYCLIPFV